jgi:hypothetical protein
MIAREIPVARLVGRPADGDLEAGVCISAKALIISRHMR